MSRLDVYQTVTDRVIAAIEAGTVPWRKPWVGGGPINVRNGRPYRGVNVFLLGLMNYGDPRWGTFRAVKECGGNVRKGEKATHVILWKPVKKRHPAQQEGEEALDDTYMLLRTYPVFNAEQCDGLPELERPNGVNTVESAEAIVTGYVGPTIAVNNVDMAAYSEILDLVTMPPTASFHSTEGYYSTLFHELVHSTGHKSRLDRLESGGFGTGPYAKEELVAEMGAAMLCGVVGLENLDQSAAYVSGWLERLRNDRKLVVQAAAQAQKASDLILGVTFEEAVSQDSEMAVAA
jgi:antirestriction protein ArdC